MVPAMIWTTPSSAASLCIGTWRGPLLNGGYPSLHAQLFSPCSTLAEQVFARMPCLFTARPMRPFDWASSHFAPTLSLKIRPSIRGSSLLVQATVLHWQNSYKAFAEQPAPSNGECRSTV